MSIFDCNPRYVERSQFQAYYKRDIQGKLGVVYHEILHFIFFEYCAQHCGQLVGSRDTNFGAYWALSELINVIILNKPEFQKFLKREELIFYPELQNIYPQIAALWEECNGNLEDFVARSLPLFAQ